MMKYRVIRNSSTNAVVLQRAKWCQSFWCHLRGLQFVRGLPDDEGLIFVTGGETIINASIHMLFMFMDIAVVWLDASGAVVDKRLAKPWRLSYAPAKPAKYYIEATPALLERVAVGDRLIFSEETD